MSDGVSDPEDTTQHGRGGGRDGCGGLGGDPLLFYKTLVRRVISEKRCLRRAGRR